MRKLESIHEFYEDRHYWIPEEIRKNLGHFNVFSLAPYIGEGAQPLEYGRREWFNIVLVFGGGVLHYSGRRFQVRNHALVFTNPYTAIVDGIGNALFGSMTFKAGVPDKSNFDTYRMIRIGEAPRKIDVHFVENQIDPTGMGEPPFPPVFAALANAMYKATGKRYYHQPYLSENQVLG